MHRSKRAAAGAASGRPQKRARPSSLASLPPPRRADAARHSVVEHVNACVDLIAADFGGLSDFSGVVGLKRGINFWRVHGAQAGASSPAAAVGSFSARNSSDLQSGANSSSSSAAAAAAAESSSQVSALVEIGLGSRVRPDDAGGVEKKKDNPTFSLQFDIMAVVHKRNATELLEELKSVSLKDAVRLTACARGGAHSWLTVHPLEEALQLSNGEMVSATRHMFGLSPISESTPWYCRCGELVEAGHFHSCNRVHGPATNTRHETVVAELATFALSHLQMHVERAPSIATADGCLIEGARHVVPDVVFRGVGVAFAIDVSFVYSESDGRVRRPLMSEESDLSKFVLSAMGERARTKVKKYEASCEEQDLRFTAFVADSHGALDASAKRVISVLVSYGAAELGCSRLDLDLYLRRRVAIAIQRGNARLDQHAMRLSRGGYGRAIALGYAQPRPGEVGGAADQ